LAAVYRHHFEGRGDFIAEAALQDFVIFAERMELAYDGGRPSALAAIEAGGPIWRLPGNIPVIM
jgi:hypothetical protein|tara:strand:+ start:47 stop:238 length:192 start_codon:yes stop_codon:yes gene_type:complete